MSNAQRHDLRDLKRRRLVSLRVCEMRAYQFDHFCRAVMTIFQKADTYAT